jgi:hypothetical protein
VNRTERAALAAVRALPPRDMERWLRDPPSDPALARVVELLKLEDRLVDHAHYVYNAIGYDAWGDRVPSDRDFVAVIEDQMRDWTVDSRHGDRFAHATNADVDRFFEMSARRRRQLILRAGP